MRLPRAGLCLDGARGLYCDVYQITEVMPGRIEARRVWANRPITWFEADHVFVVDGTYNGLHHLTPMDGIAREMLAIASGK